jgi:hypothetical protein
MKNHANASASDPPSALVGARGEKGGAENNASECSVANISDCSPDEKDRVDFLRILDLIDSVSSNYLESTVRLK